MPEEKRGIRIVVKALVVLGGIWTIAIAAYASAVQFNVGEVLSGQMPVAVAFSLARDSLPVLISLFLIGIISIGLTLVQAKIPLAAGLIWLAFGCILLYGVYLARFSIGLFLLPAGVAILIASLMILGGKIFKYF